MTGNAAIGLVAVMLVIGGYLVYQQQRAAAEAAAYNRSLGGSIANTVAGVGGIIGAAVGMAGSGGNGAR